MSRKSSFKQGGGFLNSVDGKIVGYRFTDDPPFEQKASEFNSLFFILTALVDGADEPVETSLFAGDADKFEVSKDGLTLTPVEDGYVLGGGTALSKFIQSLEEHDHPGALSDDEDVVNFEPIVNYRVRFVQEPLSADEIAKLKAKGKKTVRKGKDGKEYPITNLAVAAVYGLDEGPVKSAKGQKAKTSGKPAAKEVDSELAELATDVLVGILGMQPKNRIELSKLPTKVIQAMLKRKEKAQKEDVRKFLADADNYDNIDGVSYAADTEIVSLDK